ncbi:MAG: addiction module protein [Cyanobacteria bacterium PR.3.49]|nr:addiction module protein [Cyanobacteria bacterium PR.3.49]
MAFSREKPNNSLPDLPPQQALETLAILRKCIAARSALAELKGVCETIPNPLIWVRAIGLQEARVSSEIENIVTTTDDLYRALADTIESANAVTKEVLRYQEALIAGVRAIESKPLLSTALFCDIASTIKMHDMNVRKSPGTKIVDGNGRTIYTPPVGEGIIRKKLANLEQFIHESGGYDPLIKLAIVHYQFEAIHPFTDGNGRTGRIINILFLLQQDLLKLPVLYLSHYLIENKNEYYLRLREVTENSQWEEWIMFILDGIEKTANDSRLRISNIRRSMDETLELLRSKIPKLANKDFVELLYTNPYCKIKFVEQHMRVTRQTASSNLKSLEELGILESVKLGRDVYFINSGLLRILSS